MIPISQLNAIGESRLQVLGEDGERVLCRAWREADQGDGTTVLAVVPASEHPTPAFLDRLAHECELKDELDGAWAVRPVEVVRERGQIMLLLEDSGGEPLDRMLGAPMEVGRFLRLAIGIAMALGKLHQRGLVHKDIKPANILVNCTDGQLRLTGFGLASRLPRERQAPDSPESIAGTLAYMAPEQTGRMNRSIDSRSDLYSFGATLYQMLTGALPFTASEPMEWVHCHIARKPQAPGARVGSVPSPVSQIVMKLLAKTAEERYQTAIGVEKDLRHCLAEWEQQARIAPFALGEQDAPDRLLIPEKLYGRAREVETLLASFDRVVSNAAPELVLVSGYSGIGKSSVVNELHRALVPSQGLFAAGKFDQYKRGIPYATLAQAFQSLIRQLLSRSDAELARWRDALTEALGPNGQLMVNLIPELALIVGEQGPVPDLSPQDAQSRFQMVFRRFLGVFAQPEHPLALFLDDLQWLDAATLELLADLLVHSDVRHLLLVGAYRDNEVGPDHPLMEVLATVREAGRQIHPIGLGSLSPEHIEELIADALRTGRDHIRPLAEMVFERTGGNPFFAIHFLTELVEEGLLAFDTGMAGWSWDLARIHAKGFTDNVADLMASKLGRLPPATQEALRRMACLGSVTRAATLAMVQEGTEAEIHSALETAVRADLVSRQDGSYRFLHDRIHEAAYASIPEAERASTHLLMGRLLVARTAPEQLEGSIFEIVNQLVRGAELIHSTEERRKVAALNLMAGKRAKVGTAYGSALRYLSTGRALLPADAWTRFYRLTFDLELNLAECEFLTGDFESAERRFASLLTRALDNIDLAAATRLLLDLCVTMGDMDRAIHVGLEYLRRVDPEWPQAVTLGGARRDYDRLSERLRQLPIGRLLDLPLMTDPAQRATMDVLTALSSPTLFGGEALRQLVICRMAALCLEHGNSDGAPLAYVLLGSIQGMFFGDYQGGLRLARIGLDLVKKPGFERFRARVYSVFGVHVSNWTQPLDVARSYLRRAFDAAQESGDVSFAAFSCIDLITNLLAAGTPLSEVEREAEKNRAIVKALGFSIVRRGIAEQLAAVRMLRGQIPVTRSFGDAVLEADRHEELDSGAREGIGAADPSSGPDLRHRYAYAIAAIRELQARTFMQDCAGGIAAVERNPPLWTVPTQFERADYQFFEALSRAALCDSTTGDERRRHLDAAVEHHKQLMSWARNCPENFENRAALAGAEIARLEGRELDAERLYEQAIRSARERGFVQNEGLAYESAARFYAARGFEQIAQLYLRNARRCYLSWGAEGKVQQLDQLHPQLKEERGRGLTSTIGAPVENLDLATVIKVSQAVSGEIILDRLLDTLMRTAIEQAGAERGVLIVTSGTEQRIAVEATTSADTVTVQLRDDAATAARLPMSVLHYVLRTKDSVVLEDAGTQEPFSTDPYIRERQAHSILCLPLLNQAKLIGLLYLENNLTPSVFSPARIPVLKLLASQAAISLENTRLYRDLAEREAKIRRLVDANIIGIFLWGREGRITEANDAFLDIVGYDRNDLAAGRISWMDLTPLERQDGDAWLLRGRKMTGRLQPLESEYFRKDGGRVPVLLGAASFDQSGDQGVAFVLDLTERKQAEAEARESERRYREVQMQLAHANRVATMGQLTASIAHEINQPIGAAVTNAQAALRWLGREPPDLWQVQQALERIAKNGKQAGDVIHGLRALFKNAPPAPEGLDINAVVDEIVLLTHSEAVKNGVSVRTQFAESLPTIQGTPVQLQQVILNLIINAIEAMSDVDDGVRDLQISTERDASDGVLVTVQDSGPGLAPDALARVFEAFYTSKPTGLGLGLSICRSIIEAHGGRLWASTTATRGAMFQFTLPSGERS
ncbi:signal transduction histidine kinase [Hypericibacter terrae]|uniref:histidine kinase n=1 Tax=Hypericibacter terrae TaxID=2602015 RepID=A0A5J6MQN2_9PROT|nr:signal transduction histidine kinase [Hypericibacter terrae]